jgi:AGCS family alanine or glycine:cation symporter
LGGAFAVFGLLAGFGIGNTVQANSVAHVLESNLALPLWASGLLMAGLVFTVLIGGIRRIAEVAGKLVPLMALTYLAGGLIILGTHLNELGGAFALIVTQAFTPTAAGGGFAGATVWAAIRYGVARGVFSNEAGLGSAPIAHAAAATDSPVRQGTVAMLGTFIDTLVVCTITGLVIIVSQAWVSGETGAALSSAAFEEALPGVGGYVVTFGLSLFAFTTTLGWSFYGEKCAEYLFGIRAIRPFRLAWVLALPVGAMAELDFIWLVADTLNALMAIPNLIALLLLSPVVFKLTRDYFAQNR